MNRMKQEIKNAKNHQELLDVWVSYHTSRGDSPALIKKNKLAELKRWSKEFRGNLKKIKANLIDRADSRRSSQEFE